MELRFLNSLSFFCSCGRGFDWDAFNSEPKMVSFHAFLVGCGGGDDPVGGKVLLQSKRYLRSRLVPWDDDLF